jgi:hypothetical protein
MHRSNPGAMRLNLQPVCLRVLACQTVAPRHADTWLWCRCARLTACARSGFLGAGRDAGTGALQPNTGTNPEKKRSFPAAARIVPHSGIYVRFLAGVHMCIHEELRLPFVSLRSSEPLVLVGDHEKQVPYLVVCHAISKITRDAGSFLPTLNGCSPSQPLDHEGVIAAFV